MMPAVAVADPVGAGSAGASATGAGAGAGTSATGAAGAAAAGLVGGQLGLQLGVLFEGLAPLDDDLVEEVVDLVRVEAVLEADVLELLGDDVIRGKCHDGSSFDEFGCQLQSMAWS
jgi:hypothetical protein